MTTTYQVEKFADAIGEMEPILVKHWHEIALGHDKVPLDIAHERYQSLCDAGALRIVTARDNGVLVGYHVAIVAGHLHYTSTLHGITDVYFILPQYRCGRTGMNLFKAVEADYIVLGVKKAITGAKLHLPFALRLLQFLGYKPTETVLTKLIGE